MHGHGYRGGLIPGCMGMAIYRWAHTGVHGHGCIGGLIPGCMGMAIEVGSYRGAWAWLYKVRNYFLLNY